MKKYVTWSLLNCILVACQVAPNEEVEQKSYRSDVGFILFDPTIDNASFMLCDSTLVGSGRNSLIYADSKSALPGALMTQFEFQPSYESFSGFVVVRFLANCNRETDRFRAQSMGFDFSKKDCPLELKNHLVAIVSGIKNWNHSSRANPDLDYSKYINFKIIDGRIDSILQ